MKDLRFTYARGQSHAWEQSNFGDVTSKLLTLHREELELLYIQRLNIQEPDGLPPIL